MSKIHEPDATFSLCREAAIDVGMGSPESSAFTYMRSSEGGRPLLCVKLLVIVSLLLWYCGAVDVVIYSLLWVSELAGYLNNKCVPSSYHNWFVSLGSLE